MEDFGTIQKQISETKYLATENTYRYRPIMRYFYHKYEQGANWQYKEEIYNELSLKIDNYTLEDIERDLAFLVENGSLTTIQDVKNIETLDDFKNKKFRYQMTDYAIAIERMSIELEEMEVKVASLSPKRFEVLKSYIYKLQEIDTFSSEEFSDLWSRITNEFKDLNQNYQDFLKKFQEAKTEELLESEIFLEYKSKMISYLQDFIQGYLNNGNKIKEKILTLDSNIEDKIVKKLEDYQKETPKIYPEFNYEKFNELNRGRWHSIYLWFVGQDGISEGDRLLDVTNSIITQISKCVSSLIELHGNMILRKEEYKHICKLFDSKIDIREAHSLSSVIFGIPKVSHYKGTSTIATDSIIDSYSVPSIVIEVLPHEKKNRPEKTRVIIESKAAKKKEIIEQARLQKEQEINILRNLVNQKIVKLDGEVHLTKEERNYILNLISRSRKDKINKENLLGLKYQLKEIDGTCKIISSDGTFTMPSLQIDFEVEK